MKSNGDEEINRMSERINQIREPGDLCVVMLSDSTLSDQNSATREYIHRVDEKVHFDCMIHLGDILRGNNPEKISRRLLSEELTAYREAIGSHKLFVTQGEQDGYRDESFCGQLVCGIMRDNIWHEETAFIDRYENVHREGDAPYYYVDFPQYSTRLIFLCSSFCAFDGENMFFERYPAFDLKQLVWLKNDALKVNAGWRILLFSHAMPKSRFDTGKDPFIYKGFCGEKFLNLLQKARREQGADIVSWCAGHYRYDAEAVVASVNHVVIDSMVWDAVVLKAEERNLCLLRFGSDSTRVISY